MAERGGCRGLGPLALYALLHLEEAGIDYGLSLARAAGVGLGEAVSVLEQLEALGLAERAAGSAVKNTRAKLKLSSEVRKHHTYYTLTRVGRRLARRLRHGLLADCVDGALGEGAWRLLLLLRKAGVEHAGTLARLAGMSLGDVVALLERLAEEGLVAADSSKVVKASRRRAKPKRETRTHHRYYRLTRLAEMLLRRSSAWRG